MKPKTKSKKSKAEKDWKEEINRDYFKSLNALVDRLFEVAAKHEVTWMDMSRMSGLGGQTISKLGNRETKFPAFRTVELLAKAFGGRIDYVAGAERKAIVVKWTPKQFAGRSKKPKLKIA